MQTYLPEGLLSQTDANQQALLSPSSLQSAIQEHRILEARAILCDSGHNLTVDLGCMKGFIPRDECAVGIAEGKVKDIAILSRVNKPVCFFVTAIRRHSDGSPYAILSRRKVQEQCRQDYINALSPGDIIRAKVTHLEPFGCFADIGCGIVSLIPIDSISVSRISHPRDRFYVGQDIFAVVKSIESDGRISLSHKELLGTWQENAAAFSPGETVGGIIRSVESYGIFVELAPNLAGLAELREGIHVGQYASVFIKSILPEKMKIKLVIVDSFDANYPSQTLHYYHTSGHMDHFCYSPEGSEKKVESWFPPSKTD